MASNYFENLPYHQDEGREASQVTATAEVKGFKDTVYWVKRAVEIEKLLKSLKKSKILLDQVRRQLNSKESIKHFGHKNSK